MSFNIVELIHSIKPDEESINILAETMGYEIGKIPVVTSKDWYVFFTDKIPDNSEQGILTLKIEEGLKESSSTSEIRRFYKQVTELSTELGSDFSTEIVGFIGEKRMVFFKALEGNRDERLDISTLTVNKDLYKDNFLKLMNNSITVESDPFGFYKINGVQEAFKKELTSHFLLVVNYYRKKLSELITSTDLKLDLHSLVTEDAKIYLESKNLIKLVEVESYTAVLSHIVDTIILRQLMRRFLEAYYGADSFEVSGISLGVGKGTMEDAIKETVERIGGLPSEDVFKKLNRRETILKETKFKDNGIMDLFLDDESLFSDLPKTKIKDYKEQEIKQFVRQARLQYESVYAGDLFAGSIGEVATQIEEKLAEKYPEFHTRLWLDTSSEKYAFHYADLPPEALEKQYETSMSQNVQIKIENKQPIVYYGEDAFEQKNKGAYYTDSKFVDYMVRETVEKLFNERLQMLKKSVNTRNEYNINENIESLLNIKVADLTSGGGSFLRGAFRLLASKHESLANIKISSDLSEKYPMFQSGEEGVLEWEDHILNHMIYGVDIDYKAVMISSLTLSLSSIEHRPSDRQLPSLIGKTLIHQNSLMNSVPYYERDKIYANYQSEIAELLYLKKSKKWDSYEEKRQEIQQVLLNYSTLKDDAKLYNLEAIEINLPEIFFEDDGSLKNNPGFDVVIGNPPWEVWKPNSDEFFKKYDTKYLELKNSTQKKERQIELFQQHPSIKERWEGTKQRFKKGSAYFRSDKNFHFQKWKVDGRTASTDLNLYKLSLERFDQLVINKGKVSLLVPDNLMTDLGTSGLRHLLFDSYHVKEFLSFENRKGIFEGIHRSYKFAVLIYNKEKKDYKTFKTFFYAKDLEELNGQNKFDYQMDLVRQHSGDKYSLVETRSKSHYDLYKKIVSKYLPVRDTKIIQFGTDFHKTNDSKYFLPIEESDVPLYEGKFMNQFTVSPERVFEGVSEEMAVKKSKSLYKSYRLAFRDISSSTNKKTLVATILPKGSVGTNTLSIERDSNLLTELERLFYLGIFNSYVIDFIIRQLIDKHVNLHFFNQLPIPCFKEFLNSKVIANLSLSLLLKNKNCYDDLKKEVDYVNLKEGNSEDLIAELNARVAIGFGISRQELIILMKTFESAKHKKHVQEETQRILDEFDRVKREEVNN